MFAVWEGWWEIARLWPGKVFLPKGDLRLECLKEAHFGGDEECSFI